MSVRVGEDQQVGGRQVQAAAGLERQERSAANWQGHAQLRQGLRQYHL